MRIDKWLWAVRLFKSRTLAAEAVNGGKIKIEGSSIKPSREIKTGETLTVQSGPVKKTYKVLGLPEKRGSAKVAAENVQDITTPEEKLKEETAHRSYIARYKGSGRPTKKERRTIDKLKLY
jgi:ribosome-associated heat shock protein Hsp15